MKSTLVFEQMELKVREGGFEKALSHGTLAFHVQTLDDMQEVLLLAHNLGALGVRAFELEVVKALL